MTPKGYVKYEQNAYGLDYVCSDIHGCFDLLEYLLHRIGFDKDRDRLFCVGDLIDRGPVSHRVTDYLEKPWFYSILGNHEWMMINAVQQSDKLQWLHWKLNGGDWAQNLSLEALKDIAKRLETLPLAIELSYNGRNIGLTHAECGDYHWVEIKQKLKAGVRQALDEDESLIMLLWARTAIRQEKHTGGIDFHVHGHSIVNETTLSGNGIYIDTGAYINDHLNILSVGQLVDFYDVMKDVDKTQIILPDLPDDYS